MYDMINKFYGRYEVRCDKVIFINNWIKGWYRVDKFNVVVLINI